MTTRLTVNDTHRLPYFNGKLTAMAVGTTSPLKFYTANDEEIGFEVYTNAGGYLCDLNGTLYSSGVFLKSDATVTITLKDGTTTSWDVVSQLGVEINDGKLLDLNGNVVWSANSKNNYVLNYLDLANKPKINEWAEGTQSMIITAFDPSAPIEELTVDKQTKIISIGQDPTVTPSTGYFQVKMTPLLATRWGHTITVENYTAYPVRLLNADGVMFTALKQNEHAQITYDLDGVYRRGFNSIAISASTTVTHVKDGDPSDYILTDSIINVPMHTIYLENALDKKIRFGWYPSGTLVGKPLKVSLYNSQLQALGVFTIKPATSVYIHAFGINAGDTATIVGASTDERKFQYMDKSPDGSSGKSRVYNVSGVDDDTDVLVLSLTDVVPGTSGSDLGMVTVNIPFTNYRTKPLKICLTNCAFTYCQISFGFAENGSLVTTNFKAGQAVILHEGTAMTNDQQSNRTMFEVNAEFISNILATTYHTRVLASGRWCCNDT